MHTVSKEDDPANRGSNAGVSSVAIFPFSRAEFPYELKQRLRGESNPKLGDVLKQIVEIEPEAQRLYLLQRLNHRLFAIGILFTTITGVGMALTPLSRIFIFVYAVILYVPTFCFQGREFYWRHEFQKIWKPAIRATRKPLT